MRAKPAGTDRVSLIYTTVSGNRARRTVTLEKAAGIPSGGMAMRFRPTSDTWIAIAAVLALLAGAWLLIDYLASVLPWSGFDQF
jgi:hypothetical protein